VIQKKWNSKIKAVFQQILADFKSLNQFDATEIEKVLKSNMEANQLGFGDIFQPFRIMLSGETSGPSIFELTELMGKEMVIQRMESAFVLFDSWV
jgi:glutamyl-tRNA synthetase